MFNKDFFQNTKHKLSVTWFSITLLTVIKQFSRWCKCMSFPTAYFRLDYYKPFRDFEFCVGKFSLLWIPLGSNFLRKKFKLLLIYFITSSQLKLMLRFTIFFRMGNVKNRRQEMNPFYEFENFLEIHEYFINHVKWLRRRCRPLCTT